MNENDAIKLIQSLEFHEQCEQASSINPVHREMRLPLVVIKLAHMSVSPRALLLARNGQLQDVVVSAAENAKFKMLQITANVFLQQNGRLGHGVYSLTPRMLLPHCNEPSAASKRRNKKKRTSAGGTIACGVQAQTVESSTLITCALDQGAEQMKHEALAANVSAPSCHHHNWYNALPQESVQRALQGVPADFHPACHELCQLYEEHIQSMRDTYESVIQSLNLRLYVANHELEQLQEEPGRSRLPLP